MAESKIKIGISSCLLGEEVRHDGGHKRNSYITGTLGEWFEFVPLCPEVAIGLGVPRPTIRLVGDADRPRVKGVKDESLDVTDKMEAYGQKMAKRLGGQISGYILKSASPSCGMERVRLYKDNGNFAGKTGVGVYARELMAALPDLPVEEEGRLGDPVLRENFLQRVFVYHRWQQVEKSLTPKKLVDFHSRHKLILMAHNQAAARRIGRMVAEAGKDGLAERAREYISEVMTVLTGRATRKGHANVLMHLMGYLKTQLDGDDKAELLEMIERYRTGEVPLVVPLTLLNHHFRRHPHEYVENQHYMEPHPPELKLRNVL